VLAAAKAAALPAMRPPPALSRGEIQALETLYAVGVDAPPIRKQALDFGLGLDAAGEGFVVAGKKMPPRPLVRR